MGGMILLAASMWVLQLVLGLWQFQRFNAHVKTLRRLGRVAIGKAKGGFRSGAVVLICINDAGKIIYSEKMLGRTVFAAFQEMPELNNKFLPMISVQDCEGLGKQVTTAVLNARQDYENYQELQAEHKNGDVAAIPN
ncbi:MAG: transcriptional regulator GutM [Selenomonas sp.]|uniref:transcriptional regulator GutM n=1 Tax=Selenomonas sp. TaxID=2053611 RepID=UPI0025D399C5|nr:transcriptional regulator GutM [Selenomonas sp.]MCR5756635.1 transcriptional regulator GutM [Selenomonas sp.]